MSSHNKRKVALERRIEVLNFLYSEASKSYNNKKDELHAKINAANLILISWAFIFGGVVGLFQAGILHSDNIQSISLFLLVMAISICCCIIPTATSRYEASAPNVAQLWKEYETSATNSNSGNNLYLQLVERATISFIEARGLLQADLEKKSCLVTIAAAILLITIFIIIFYVMFPDFSITVSP